MKIRVECHSVNDNSVETTETTLEKFLEEDDGIDETEAARIKKELETTGHSRVPGFVGIYADLFKL